MSIPHPRGLVYRCNICGAEVTVLAFDMGRFAPRCCNAPMQPREGRAEFYQCPVCGAELAVVKPGTGEFRPRCCNTDMQRMAA